MGVRDQFNLMTAIKDDCEGGISCKVIKLRRVCSLAGDSHEGEGEGWSEGPFLLYRIRKD